jgi:serine/threonine protein kinase
MIVEVALRGHSRLPDCKVAIKFLHRELSKESDKLKRLIQEAKLLKRVNLPE